MKFYTKENTGKDELSFAHEIPDNRVLLNDVVFPKHIDPDSGFNPHGVKAYIIGNEYGALCLVWASYEGEALDNAVDGNMMNSMLAEEQDYDNGDLTPLGNASELFDLSYAWVQPVDWQASRDIHAIVRIIRAVENQQTTIDK